ncbi:MAG: hypothetical protein C0424_05165 [Sphingobacteriaceae bacterium]|nr:hypothetical protein [Sphingobacteriaceae bacterium]
MIPVQKGFWLSAEMASLLTELNVFLINEIDNKIDQNRNPDEELIQLGILHLERIRAIRNRIQAQLYHDFKSLHEIEKFVKSSRDLGSFAVYSKAEDYIRTR